MSRLRDLPNDDVTRAFAAVVDLALIPTQGRHADVTRVVEKMGLVFRRFLATLSEDDVRIVLDRIDMDLR